MVTWLDQTGSHGAGGSNREEYGRSLVAAAAAGHLNVVNLLAKSGATMDATDDQGQTALMRAVHREDREMIELLLRLGSDVNKQGLNGDTALNVSIRGGERELVSLILGAGADPTVKKRDGKDAWDVARSWKRQSFIEMLNAAAGQSGQRGGLDSDRTRGDPPGQRNSPIDPSRSHYFVTK